MLAYWVADAHRAVWNLVAARDAGKYGRFVLAELESHLSLWRVRLQKVVRSVGVGRVWSASWQLLAVCVRHVGLVGAARSPAAAVVAVVRLLLWRTRHANHVGSTRGSPGRKVAAGISRSFATDADWCPPSTLTQLLNGRFFTVAGGPRAPPRRIELLWIAQMTVFPL